MKILLIQAGLPHYFNLVINRITAQPNIEIVALIPKENSGAVGSGVHQDRTGVNFRIEELPEKKRWWTKPFFEGLPHLLSKEKPDAIIVGWPYILGYLFDSEFKRIVKKLNIKIIYKDIPFNIPPYNCVHQYFVSGQIRNEKGTTAKGFLAYVKYRALTYFRKKYLNKVDAHIYYTDAAPSLIGTYGVATEKIFITANSPDTDILLDAFREVKQRPLILPPNPYRLIHVGRLVQWKRVDAIIDAVNILKNQFPQIELLVVGFGPEEVTLKQQVNDLHLEPFVKFIGGVYHPIELGQYLHESSVYILAGMGGLSINDAMCFAKPIICSVADGTEAKLVRHGENGYYFEEGNVLDLTNKIADLLSNQNRVAMLGNKSLSIIEQEVNIHTVVDKYLELFRFVSKA